MSQAQIVVVGSSNIDMVVKSDRIPRGGETLLGGDFVMAPGGKGANQAVCATRLGADVQLVARVGDDVFGNTSLANFASAGVRTDFLVVDSGNPSGIALITVDAAGENAIVVAPGANLALTPEDVDQAKDAIASADAVVLQFEIPPDTVMHTIRLARLLGTRVVLNPAPMRPMPSDALAMVDVLIPNEHEAAGLLGKPDAANMDPAEAAADLRALGAGSVVVTLGSKGAYILSDTDQELVESKRVVAVDTTAAGDAFTAALTVGLSEGMELAEAAQFASRVAAIAVTRMGAQPSMPAREEVESYVFGN